MNDGSNAIAATTNGMTFWR